MKTFTRTRAVQAALIAAAIGSSTAALADIKDYKFELVSQTVEAGPDKVITVRLMNTRTGKPVPGAVIFATRSTWRPTACRRGDQDRPAAPSRATFKATLSMAGAQLSSAPRCRVRPARSNKLVITAQK